MVMKALFLCCLAVFFFLQIVCCRRHKSAEEGKDTTPLEGQTQLNGLEDNSENMCHELEEQIQDEKDQRQRLEEEKLSLQNEVKLLHSISKGQADTISSLEHGCTKKRPVWSQHYNHNVKTMRIFDELKAVLDTSEVENEESSCRDGDLRVSEGSPQEGYLEYCADGAWGIVCGDKWDANDSVVACRQLGYKPSASPSQTQFTLRPDEALMYLSFINCASDEDQLSQCAYESNKGPTDGSEWEGKDYCPWEHYTRGVYLYKLARIMCSEERIEPQESCESGDLRVSKGTFEDGFLEYCVDSQWGVVCGDNWGNKDAKVACRQLGFYAAGSPSDTEYVGKTDATPMYLSFINCTGDEEQLSECPFSDSLGPADGTVHEGKDYCDWKGNTDGLWNYALAKVYCIRLSCPDLSTAGPLSVIYSPEVCRPGNLHVGCNATYECTEGALSTSSATRTCMANTDNTAGLWDGDVESIECKTGGLRVAGSLRGAGAGIGIRESVSMGVTVGMMCGVIFLLY